MRVLLAVGPDEDITRHGTDLIVGTHLGFLAEKDLGVAFRNDAVINPVERGHIAFRTDDIEAFKALLERAGITDLKFHDLRRTMASHARSQSAMETVSRTLGHADVKVTKRSYAHLRSGDARNAMQDVADELTKD